MERIEGEASGDDDDDDVSQPTTSVACELPVTKEVEALQRQALDQIGTTAQKVRLLGGCGCTEHQPGLTLVNCSDALVQLELMDDSVQSIDRLILQIEMQKASLFRTFHDAAFKGYAHISQPKETLRALLKFAPPSASSSPSIAAATAPPLSTTTTTTTEPAPAMTAAATFAAMTAMAPAIVAPSSLEATEAAAIVAATDVVQPTQDAREREEDVEMASE